MIHVTEGAIKWLQAIDFPVDRVLRLESVDTEHLVLTFGDPQGGDLVVEENGQDLLHVPCELSTGLIDAELDRVETANGPKIALFAYDWDPEDTTAEAYELPERTRVAAMWSGVYRLEV